MARRLRVYVCLLLAAALIFLSGSVIVPSLAETPVRIGGFPTGISLDIDGLLVESTPGVSTEFGTVKVEGIEVGDIICKVNGVTVRSAEDVQGALTVDDARIELIRRGESMTVSVRPATEVYTQKPRLGIKVKDRIYGIGTVTFVRADGTYAALGHEIYDSETDTHIPFASGSLHDCRIMGIKRGRRGEAGALLASIVAGSNRGTVKCNNAFGIAGEFSGKADGESMELASRDEVEIGSASIRTSIGGAPEYFDIEIIKANKRAGKHEKSMVFRVTDKKLLNETGGIVRGMSGSPIVQNGKIIGAVTHVFLNDFTKGYAVFADCLN